MAPKRARRGHGRRLAKRLHYAQLPRTPDSDRSRPSASPEAPPAAAGPPPANQSKWERRVRQVRRNAERELREAQERANAVLERFPPEMWQNIGRQIERQQDLRALMETASNLNRALRMEWGETFHTEKVPLDAVKVQSFEVFVSDRYKCRGLKRLWIQPSRYPYPPVNFPTAGLSTPNNPRPGASANEQRLEACLQRLGRNTVIELRDWCRRFWPHLPVGINTPAHLATRNWDARYWLTQRLFWMIRRHPTGLGGLSTMGDDAPDDRPWAFYGPILDANHFVSAADYVAAPRPPAEQAVAVVTAGALGGQGHIHMKTLDLSFDLHPLEDPNHFARFLTECQELEKLKLRLDDVIVREHNMPRDRADRLLHALTHLPAGLNLPRRIKNLLLWFTPHTDQGWRDLSTLFSRLDADNNPVRNLFLNVLCNTPQDIHFVIAMLDVFFGPDMPRRDSFTLRVAWAEDIPGTVNPFIPGGPPLQHALIRDFHATGVTSVRGWPAIRGQLRALTMAPYTPVPYRF